MSTTTSSTAMYKGRAYRCLFLGATKFGRRAHLQFMDGSKDFWVAANLVTEGGQASTSRAPARCTCDSDPSGWCPKCDGSRRRNY